MLQNFPSRGLPLSIESTNISKSTSRLSSTQRPKRQRQPSGQGSVRKLVLVPANATLPPPVSESFFNTTWDALNSALVCIFQDAPITTSCERLYRGVEYLCRADKSRALWDNLKLRMKNHIINDFLEREMLSAVEVIAASGGITSKTNNMANIVERVWTRWTTQLGLIRNIFFFMDRSYLLTAPAEKSIWDTGLELFRKIIIENAVIGSHLNASLMTYFERNRSHDNIQVSLICNVVRMLSTLGVYPSTFHPQFIAATSEHYGALANLHVETMAIPDYLKLVLECLAFENEQATTFGLERVTRNEAVAVVKNQLVRNEVETIVDRGFDALLDADEISSLSDMYDLFEQVDQEKVLIAAWSEYIRREGLKLVMEPSKDAVMVPSLLSFKAKLDNIMEKAFKRNDSFDNAMRESFDLFINKRPNVPAEMIAKYVDDILRVGNKEMEDHEMTERMDRVLVLFRFIQGKDVFEAFYKKDLAKRLLLNKSASDDAERSMLSRLKTECGTGFTQKLEGMFKDIELSKDFMTSFKNSKYVSNKNDGGIDLYVNALSQAFWPSYPDVPLVLPPHMAEALENFKKFYLTKQTGRRLTWRHSLGHCVVKADLPKGKKELSMSLFQTVVLLLFNDVPDGRSLSYEEIKAATSLDDRELARTLQSLACGRIRILVKEPKGKDVNPGDLFRVDLKFEEKAYRLRINQIQLKETPEENKDTHDQVKRDRQYEIQACVIRIMKSRKTIRHVELIQQTIEQTKNRGTLDLGDIKKNIEKLIEKEYMERQGGDSYVYLA
ncbi:Cullin family-domain-containing protein [Lipomyces kononenkoae]|uniref:Cullin family-domain-containing protein n=1 Tax=Lipomyces kononenkoae TaxID=34357 RepID=A0ACC3T523_LIPKO